MEGLVSAGQRYRRILSVLVPAGAFGMTVLLGSAGAKAAREMPTGPEINQAPPARVAERLAAIRDAMSDVSRFETGTTTGPDGTERLAWHNWRNVGWPLWSDWHNKWKDWNNNWHNGWNNWGNNWNNWSNGWRNY
jgi:hypothetical protein